MKNTVEKEKKNKGTEGKKVLNRLMERSTKIWRWIGRNSKKKENRRDEEQTVEKENEEDQKGKWQKKERYCVHITVCPALVKWWFVWRLYFALLLAIQLTICTGFGLKRCRLKNLS